MLRFELAILGLLLGAATARAHPHTSPTIWVDYEVKPDGVACIVTLQRQLLEPWVGKTLTKEAIEDAATPMAADRRAALLTAARKAMERLNPVRIDGVPAHPIAKEVRPPPSLYGADRLIYIELVFSYPCVKPPRAIDLVWHAIEGAKWQNRPTVPGILKYSNRADNLEFTAEEPEYIWHAPAAREKQEIEAVTPPPPVLRLPLGSIAVALLALVWIALLLRPKASWAPAGLVLACAAAAVFLLKDLAVAEVPSPWTKSVHLPAGQQAEEIFATLHKNIYLAFDASTEDEIYRLLSLSVDASILDQLYASIYESLILREQGGAVTTIDKVEVTHRHVEFPPPEKRKRWPPEFHVDWGWRVYCSISHWGHTHKRVNEYKARYTVRFDGHSWKIAGVDVKEHRRLNLDAQPVSEGRKEFR